MNNYSNASNRLREMADEIDQIHASMSRPLVERCDIPTAFKVLRAALGDVYISIDPPAMNLHAGRVKIEVDEWSVYDGKKSHKGKTLEAAVNICLEHHAPSPVDAAESVIEALCPLPL